MRLTHYNILDGGVGRADPLAEVIEASRPDVVVLVEADDAEVTERIAKRLNMDSITGRGRKHTVAILSRWAIAESVNHAPLIADFSACLLEATIRTPDGGRLPLFAVHLHARAKESDEDARLKQWAHLHRLTSPLRAANTPHLLAGDFNANAPSQRIDLARAHPNTRAEAEKNGGTVPRRLVQSILDAGYLDTLAAARGAHADTFGSFTTQHPQQRVDYIFAFGLPAGSIREAWVEHDRLATYASDHYPVGVEIQLP